MRVEVYNGVTTWNRNTAVLEVKHRKRLLTVYLSKYAKRWSIERMEIQ